MINIEYPTERFSIFNFIPEFYFRLFLTEIWMKYTFEYLPDSYSVFKFCSTIAFLDSNFECHPG